MTTEAPTRCCVQTQKGTRCANEPSPLRPSRKIGPVTVAACGLDGHQRALWSLPDFVRHDAYCGAKGCDRPSNAGICQKHRDLYRDFGITERALLATEPTMSDPTPAPAPGAQPPADDAIEPSAGDVAEAAAAAEVEAATAEPSLPGRWGQQHSAPCEGPPARGHEPTAPGPTLADMQARAIAAEQRADRAELDAVSERARGDLLGEDAATQRARAEAAEQQLAAVTADRYERLLDDMTQSRDAAINELHRVSHALYLLGAEHAATAYEALCHILPPDRLVDLRRVEEALAAAEVARVRCRRGSPEALADAIAAHASAVHRLTEAEQVAS